MSADAVSQFRVLPCENVAKIELRIQHYTCRLDTSGNGLLLGGKLQPKLKQNMSNIVYRSDLLRRIMNQCIYSDVYT